MDWVFREIKERILLSPSQPPYFLTLPPPPPPPPQSNLESSGFNLNNKVSPSILLIIIILAIIFFVSGVLHLFVRFLLRPPNRDPDELDNVTALQGQLQQLFDLHDAGVDQSFIDTLPVFNYKSIIGVKNPFDCAVCLCEFESEDKLRLLPKCSHAFHMGCIDTWLLSHSTCPLCRANLIPDFSTSSPIVLVLESGSESSREILPERDSNSIPRENSQLGFHHEDEIDDFSGRIELKEEENQEEKLGSEAKVVAVKLGKFKNVDGGGGGGGEGEGSSENNNVDGRRCFSMGSFEYVMDDNSLLKVPIRTPMKKQSSKNKPSLFPLTPGHRPAMSECGGDSRREFVGFDANRSISDTGGGGGGGLIGRSKRESFSISKIWLRGKNGKPNPAVEGSRRAFSFRLPVHRSVVAPNELKPKNGGGGGGGDIEIGNWGENGGSEFGFDEENIHSSNSLDSQANPPSFARRTLLWLKGKQNKVVHSSFNNNL